MYISWSFEYCNGKRQTFMYVNKKKIKVPEICWKITLWKLKIWDFLQKWLLNRVIFTFSNGGSFELFLETHCYNCKYFDIEMLGNPEINTCDILYKILEQQCYTEKMRPEVYRFKRNEFNKCREGEINNNG